MALPVRPPPKPNDTAILGWAALTVRIAWTLVVCGVRVHPEVLRDARAHVLYQLDPSVPLAQAEDLATRWVEAYVARARGQLPTDAWPADWEMPLSPRWQSAVCAGEDGEDPIAALVLRKHYGDGRSLGWIASRSPGRADAAALEAAQAGLREAIRRTAVADGLPLDGWDSDRIDRLLRRVAAWAPPGCPAAPDVAEGCHREHVAGCARCDRLVRLVQGEVLTLDDLYPPTVGARPSSRARVLALQIHPDGRRARRRLVEELPTPAHVLGEDLLLLDATEIDALVRVLRIAAEVGIPAREHLRGALLDGPGSWTSRGLLGPLADRVAREVLQRSWGMVDGLGTLPEPLPDPPSARGAWAAALGMGALAVGAVLLAAVPPVAQRGAALQASFVEGRGGAWVSFDVPERTVVTMVGEIDGELFPILASQSAADKAAFATGDGTYRLHVAADAVLVAATDAPVAAIGARIRDASTHDEPLEALAEAPAARRERPGVPPVTVSGTHCRSNAGVDGGSSGPYDSPMTDLGSASRFDLHLHSLRSDGRYAPEAVLERCARAGLDVVALTDHDLAVDVAPGPREVAGRTLTVLGGAEISGVHERRELHLLVYFPGEVPAAFRAFCAEQCRARAARYAAAVASLALPGLALPDDDALRGDAALTRHHLARALVAQGHVGTVREAFARYLGEGFGHVPPITLPFLEAIRFARAQGGVTSWAHPPLGLLDWLPTFVAAGLQGIEALRPNLNSDARHRYRSAARRHGLVLTGGSDWHGWTDDADLGLFRVERREIQPFVDLLLAA
ncbi:MAG: hypothetical protein R3F59_03950 [Myxococcota bacterium]